MAASPRPPRWAIGHTELNAGVLGETALPRFYVLNPAFVGLGLGVGEKLGKGGVVGVAFGA